MKKFSQFLALSLLAFWSVACGSDKNETPEEDTSTTADVTYSIEDITGRWEILDAYRENTRTELMSDLYFEFKADGQMITNMPGGENAAYTMIDNVILQRGSIIEADYRIKEIKDSVMVLNTELRDQAYRFYLKQAATKVPEEL